MIRTFEKDGNILPSIINVVNSIPEDQIFNQQYFLRHPTIIVRKSYKRVFLAFDNVLLLTTQIENHYIKLKDISNYNFEPLAKSILELLDSINSFIEDCQHIFKATTPFTLDTQKIKSKFVSDWLRKAKHPTQKGFFNSVKDYKDEIGYYINNYKHEHGRIDIILGVYNNEFTIGYIMKFIGETPDGNMETLDLNKVRTLYLDINYHFYQFYNIAESFTEHFLSAQKVFYGINIKVMKFDSKEYGVDDLIERMKYKDLLIFPNNDLFTPKVLIELNDKSLTLKYPFGITEQNTNHINLMSIEGKDYPENSLIVIPSSKAIRVIEEFTNGNRQEGDSLNLSLDDSSYFLKIFLIFESNRKNDEIVTYIELNYDNYFKIKSYTNIGMSMQFESEIQTKLHVKIFDVDYLGMKITKNK